MTGKVQGARIRSCCHMMLASLFQPAWLDCNDIHTINNIATVYCITSVEQITSVDPNCVVSA